MEKRTRDNMTQTARIAGYVSIFALAGLAYFLAHWCVTREPDDRFVIRNNTDFKMEITIATEFSEHKEVLTLSPGESARTRSLGDCDSSVDRLRTCLESGLARISFRNLERGLTLDGPDAAETAATTLRRDPEEKGGNISLELKPVLKAMMEGGGKP
ncbi:MAG: hypothetical protein JXD23_01650 [Spirochaetales bacterium]|nr:hypothetical protein [Spirochaetales bacterium]